MVLLLVAGILLYSTLRKIDPADVTKSRRGIDPESGKVFMIRIVEGESAPWKNPDTGQRTLFPAEACYWTRDGKATLNPTFVFVKAYLGSKEKTYCPDCGREVRTHNPMPPDELMAKAAEEKNAK